MSEKLYFGSAVKKITPSYSLPLSGYFRYRISEGVLDDLEVRVLLLQCNSIWGAIIQFDLITVSQELIDAFYHEIADLEDLSPCNMIVTATHTHTAPVVSSSRPGFHADYLAFVVRQAATAVREARNNMAPGEMLTGQTSDSRFAFNRRFWMKDGSVMTNPGKLNPDIVRPEGEIDPLIPLLGIQQDGKLRILIANIVNHTDTVGGHKISADWPGFFTRTIKEGTSADVLVFPLIGASGNINHWDVHLAAAQTSYADAELIGKGYAETVLKALSELSPLRSPELTVKQMAISIPLRAISEEELRAAEHTLEKLTDTPDIDQYNAATPESQVPDIVEKYYARAICKIAHLREPATINLVGLFLGNVCLLSLPGEPFVEIGLELKNIFKPHLVMIISHANGNGHRQFQGVYIPNFCNFSRGGYETVPRSSSLTVRASELLIDAWKKLAGNSQL